MWDFVSPLKIFELKLVLTILYSINKETVIISITINLRTAIFVWPEFSVLTFNFVLIIQSFWVPTFKNILIFVSSLCVSIASPVKIGFPFRSLEIAIVGLQNKGNPGFDYNIDDKWKICSLYFLPNLKFIELTIKDFSCPNGSSSTICGMKQIISLFTIFTLLKPKFSW